MRAPTSRSMSLTAAKPIISRSTSASGAFSRGLRRFNVSSVVCGSPVLGLRSPPDPTGNPDDYWEPFARYSAPFRRASRTSAPADPTPRPGTRPDRGPITVHSQPCLPLARRVWKMRPVACQATTTRKSMKLPRALRDNERISDLMGGGAGGWKSLSLSPGWLDCCYCCRLGQTSR